MEITYCYDKIIKKSETIPEKYTWAWIDTVSINELSELLKNAGIKEKLLKEFKKSTRAKIRVRDDYSYFLLKELSYDKKLMEEKIFFITQPKLLITYHQKPIRSLVQTKKIEKLEEINANLEKVLVNIVSDLVENNFQIIEEISNNSERVERKVVSHAATLKVMNMLFLLKKDLIYLHKILFSEREVISSIQRGDIPHLRSRWILVNMLGVYDDIIAQLDLEETSRDILTTILEIHLSILSNRLNNIMLVFTVITLVFVVPNVVGGFFGMNVPGIPQWNFFAIVIVTLISVALSLLYLELKGYFKEFNLKP